MMWKSAITICAARGDEEHQSKGIVRGDMQTNEDVAQLNILLSREKVQFWQTLRELRNVLKPVDAPADIDERLMAYADEFGTDSAILMLKRSPKLFDIEGKVDKQVIHAAAPKVEKLVMANRTMAGLVVQRENILVAENPERVRVYIDNGREFTIETLDGQLVQYVDTGEIEKQPVVKEDGSRAKRLRQLDSEEQEEKQKQEQQDDQDQDQGQVQ